MKNKLKTSSYIIECDSTLWKQFKIACATEDITIKEKLNQLIKFYVQPEKFNKKNSYQFKLEA